MLSDQQVVALGASLTVALVLAIRFGMAGIIYLKERRRVP